MRNALTFVGSINSLDKPEAGVSAMISRGKHQGLNKQSVPTVEPLEDRRLLSVSPLGGIHGGPSTGLVTSTSAIIQENVNVPFTADLGNFTYPAPGTSLKANISWGDGTTSVGVIKSDGVTGVDELKLEVDGSHTYSKTGSFAILASVYQPGVTTTAADVIVKTFHDRAIVTGVSVSTPLNGSITGTYALIPPTTGVAGTEYVFNGTGAAGVLGAVSAHAQVTLSSSTASTGTNSLATGTLTLTSSSTATASAGSVTVQLTAVATSEPGKFPPVFNYVITGGTGAYAGASGRGTIAVTLGNSTAANSFEFVITSASAVSVI